MGRATDTWSETTDLPEGGAPPAPPEVPPSAPDGEVLGYTLGERLGAGGMGEVRAAHDPVLRREVAVKRLRRVDPDSTARFVAEAQVTAQLDHPNIVPVHALGTDAEGRPVLVMKRIRGRSLLELLQTGALGLEARLDTFRRVCDAVAFAHARGVLHRDLKPDNVMVGDYGEVLLVDWGLARPLGPDPTGARPSLEVDRFEAPADRTRAGRVAGTPAYMAPEQAEGRLDALDARTDVYGLGATLYAVVTGHAPLEGPTDEVLARARAGRVPRPSERAAVPRELEAIILKAMAREPSDRYPSAVALREDVDAWLARRPLVHLRSTPTERLRKWVARHRGAVRTAVGVGALAAAVLLAGLVRYVADVGAARDRAFSEAERARAAERTALAELVGARVALADSLVAQGEVTAAGQALREADALAVANPDIDRRALDWALSAHVAASPRPLVTCTPHGAREVIAVGLSDDGARAASVDASGGLRVWDTADCAVAEEREIGPLARAAVRVRAGAAEAVVASPTGAWVVRGDRQAPVALDAGHGRVFRLGFDGERGVVAFADGTSAWIDLDTGAVAPVPGRVPGGAVGWPIGPLRVGTSYPTGWESGGAWSAGDLRPRVIEPGVTDVAATADGRWVALASAFGHEVRDLRLGVDPGGERPTNRAWAGGGRPTGAVVIAEAPGAEPILLASGFDGAVEVLRLRDGQPLAALEGDGSGQHRPAAATPDGGVVVQVGAAGTLRVHVLPAPRRVALYPEGQEPAGSACHALAVSPDGELLALGDDGGALQVVDRATRVVRARWTDLPLGARTARFSSDGTRLLVGLRSGRVAVFPVAGGEPRAWEIPGRAPAVDWLDGERAFALDTEGGAWVIDTTTGARRALGRPLEGSSWDAVVVPGTTRVAIGTHAPAPGGAARGYAAILLDAADGRVLHSEPVSGALYRTAASPDGALLATGTQEGTVLLWDARTGERVATLAADGGPTLGVAFSPDGALLATTGFDGRVDLWDVAQRTRLRRMVAHTGPGVAVAFAPDGRELISTGGEHRAVLLPLDAHRVHAVASAALAGPAQGHAAAWASLGLWPRVARTVAAAAPGPATDRLRAKLALWTEAAGPAAR